MTASGSDDHAACTLGASEAPDIIQYICQPLDGLHSESLFSFYLSLGA